jgi:CRISPR-associated protein Cas1
MATYYLREQGAVVRKQDERLLVTKDRKIVAQVPMHQLEQLVVMGNIQLTTPAVGLLLQSDVDVVFTTIHGRVRGRLLHNESKFAELRLKQLQMMTDERANLAVAIQVVVGKLTNQQALLRRRIGESNRRGVVETATRGIADMIARAANADNADSLRGFEGKAGTWYWPAFKTLLTRDMGFTGRNYYPPKDPVNALLSFGYALLQRDLTAAVQLVGLDPYLGFFHTVHYGRPSLALDLMEEFRPLIVDPVVVDLINRAGIGEQDFRRGSENEKPLLLREEAVKRVIEAYEEQVTTKVRYPLTGEEATYRRCFELQTRQMARVIRGEAAAYKAILSAERNAE